MAIEVLGVVFVIVLLPIQALVTLCPGAKMSTTDPKLLKLARESAMVVSPTVMTEGARAGLVDAPLTFLLPAATVTWMLARVSCVGVMSLNNVCQCGK